MFQRSSYNSSYVVLVAFCLLNSFSSAFRRLPEMRTTTSHSYFHDDGGESNNKKNSTNTSNTMRNLTQSQQHHRRRMVSVPIPDSANGHLVTDLPLLDKSKFPTSHWAGLLPASANNDKYLFYWMFAPDNGSGKDVDFSDTSIPLVIWLNGGPACSSMDGLWLENGPFRLTAPTSNNDDWTIEMDEYSWHKSPAFVVYIDQPVGTGISFTTSKQYPKNDLEVNTDFYYFLKEFLKFHQDKFLKNDDTDNGSNTKTLNRPLFFSGESHAGHYIPSMMNYIQQQNALSTTEIQIPLAGAAIGNGWIDPYVQYSAHEAAYGKGIIGLSQKRAMEEREKQCQNDLRQGKYVSRICFSLLDSIIENSNGKKSGFQISQYDARKMERTGIARDFPKGHKDVEAYLGGLGTQPFAGKFQDVLKAIHSLPSYESGQQYEECTDPPYEALKHQDGLGVTDDVVELLNHNIRLLFFNGIEDMICNHVGNEIAVENFEWKYQEEYQIAPRYGWKAASSTSSTSSTSPVAGYMKEYENLMYLKIKDSGHMVPMDVPNIALDMIRTLIYEQSFENYKQDIDRQGKKKKGGSSDNDDDNDGCPICPASSTSDNDDDDDDGTTCPKCPSCPSNSNSNNSDDNTETKNPEDWEAWAEKSPAVLVGVGVVSTWLVTLWTYWICAKRKRGGRNNNNSNSYMEMKTSAERRGGQQGLGYSDNAAAAATGANDGFMDEVDEVGLGGGSSDDIDEQQHGFVDENGGGGDY